MEENQKVEENLEELLTKDVTPDLEIKTEVEEEEKEEELRDHPGVILLDMAVEQSVEFCKKNDLPPPNTKVYRDFSRPFLNKAFWHYFPDGELPDNPKVALLLGLAGIGIAYIPTIIAYYEKRKKIKQSTEKKKEEQEEKQPEEKTEAKAEDVKSVFEKAWSA